MSVVVREPSKIVKFSQLSTGDAGSWVEFRSNQQSDRPLDAAGRLERLLQDGGVELSHFRPTCNGEPFSTKYGPSKKIPVGVDPCTLVTVRTCIYVPEISEILDKGGKYAAIPLENGREVSLFFYQLLEGFEFPHALLESFRAKLRVTLFGFAQS